MRPLRQVSAVILLALVAACQDSPISPRTAKLSEIASSLTAQAELGSGWIIREGRPVKVSFEIRGTRAIFEGDIDLGPADRIAPTREALMPGRRTGSEVSPNVVTTNTGLRWPNGRVPYVIDANVPNQQRILTAFAMFHSNVAGVFFAPRQSYDNNYIRIQRTTDPNICGQSQLGRVGGAQSLVVRDDCQQPGVIVHELDHALGIYHEQSRCDRNSFVQILSNNIQVGWADQFTQFCGNGKTDLLGYDEGSIMHYSSTAFGKIRPDGSQLTTIVSLRGRVLGQRDTLSTADVGTINQMYAPYPVQNLTNSYPNGVPTIGWSATPRASSYGVNMVVVYSEFNDYENTSTVYDYTSDAVGVTTQLSLQDTQRSFTGRSVCYLYQTVNGADSYSYYYEVTAIVPGGVGTQRSRTAAQVAPTTC